MRVCGAGCQLGGIAEEGVAKSEMGTSFRWFLCPTLVCVSGSVCLCGCSLAAKARRGRGGLKTSLGPCRLLQPLSFPLQAGDGRWMRRSSEARSGRGRAEQGGGGARRGEARESHRQASKAAGATISQTGRTDGRKAIKAIKRQRGSNVADRPTDRPPVARKQRATVCPLNPTLPLPPSTRELGQISTGEPAFFGSSQSPATSKRQTRNKYRDARATSPPCHYTKLPSQPNIHVETSRPQVDAAITIKANHTPLTAAAPDGLPRARSSQSNQPELSHSNGPVRPWA